MAENPVEFGRLLKRANRIIAAREEKTISIWHDELGYSIGREGGTAIAFWERGNIPSKVETLELLAEKLTRKKGLESQAEVEQFLDAGGHPGARNLAKDIWYKAWGEPSPSPPPPIEPGPFVGEGPIFDPRQFFGRETELEDIFAGLKNTPFQHKAITGRWRSGKTSLLYYVKNITKTSSENLRPGQRNDWLSKPNDYRWIWVSFGNPRMQQREKFLRLLMRGFEMPVPDPCNLDNFWDTVAKHRIQKPTVVLMDSIRVGMESSELDLSFWGQLRALVQAWEFTNGQLAFLITSQKPVLKQARESGKESPYFNLFNSIELGALTEDKADEMIKLSPEPFAPEDIDWIIDQSERWPSLLQILCRERLTSLERGETDEAWKRRGLQRLATIKEAWKK